MPKQIIRLVVTVALLLASNALAAPATTQAIERNSDGITLHLDDGVMRLQFWSDRIVRVHFSPAQDLPAESKSLAVIGGQDPKVNWDYQQTPKADVLTTAQMQVKINRATGVLSFANAAGKSYLEETPDHARTIDPSQVRQAFRLGGEEAIYGLGQHQNGLLNYRGTTVHLQQANTDVAVPLLLSSSGYGLLWDNPSVTNVSVSAPTFMDRMSITSEVGSVIDYYFIAGPSLDDAIAGYRQLTGAAPMMPRWMWGLWQSKERYKSQKELLDVAAHYRKMNAPIDVVVQDWQYWGPDQWGSHAFDPKRYPDPKGMVDQLHQQNVHLLISVWPKFDLGTDNFKELQTAGALYPPVFPSVYPPGRNQWYDAFNPEARRIYWQQISRHLATLGIDAWWLDASEPELGGNWGQMRTLPTALGAGASVFNAYPLMHTTAVFEGQRADFPRKRVVILTRSAYAGQQRNGAVTWSGDIHGNWETLRRQVPAGLNFCASGIPYWNTDIGGFFGSAPADANFRELFTRWYQFGAFCPMFRVHGTGPGKEMWQFDDATQKILLTYDQWRYRLLPYIYSVSWRVTSQGYTMMRPLAMDFRSDPAVRNITDQYLFGPSLLVNPVVSPRVSSRNVYLPAGQSWFDFWTGETHDGGVAVDAAAPIQTMPLFVRAGSIVPLGPIVQYADESPAAPLELRIYRGADAAFDLYDDEGDNYDYQTGSYSIIPIRWDEAKHTLTIGERTGDFPGSARKRQFNIVWVKPGHGTRLGQETHPEQAINYDGPAVSIPGPVN
jgi:alpha-D-xyloside xylohydrolase